MAHKLEIKDGKAPMLYVDVPRWHELSARLTKPVRGKPGTAESLPPLRANSARG